MTGPGPFLPSAMTRFVTLGMLLSVSESVSCSVKWARQYLPHRVVVRGSSLTGTFLSRAAAGVAANDLAEQLGPLCTGPQFSGACSPELAR